MTGNVAGEIDFDKLFASIDAMDAEGFVGFLAPDAVFRFGSAPPVGGRAAIREAVGGFFDSIGGLRHELHRFLAGDECVFCDGEVTYTRRDGSQVTLPFADVFESRDGLITLYGIYIDIAPLYAE
jgi:ketosteroid isomerase-like protein